MTDSDTKNSCDDYDDSDSDSPRGSRLVTGLFGCCTATGTVSLLWMVTGSPWVVTGVSVAVMSLFMLENISFYEEIRALEGAIRVKERKIQSLKSTLADLTTIRKKVLESPGEVSESLRRVSRRLKCDSARF